MRQEGLFGERISQIIAKAKDGLSVAEATALDKTMAIITDFGTYLLSIGLTRKQLLLVAKRVAIALVEQQKLFVEVEATSANLAARAQS